MVDYKYTPRLIDAPKRRWGSWLLLISSVAVLGYAVCIVHFHIV